MKSKKLTSSGDTYFKELPLYGASLSNSGTQCVCVELVLGLGGVFIIKILNNSGKPGVHSPWGREESDTTEQLN